MNIKYENFLNDYIGLSHDDFVEKYGRYDSDLPSKNEFFNYLMAENRLNLMIDIPGEVEEGRTLFLIEDREQHKFEMFTLFRDVKVNERYFDNIQDAVFEKIRRIISSLMASRR